MTRFEYGKRFEGFDPSYNQEKVVTLIIDGRRISIPEKASTEEFWKK